MWGRCHAAEAALETMLLNPKFEHLWSQAKNAGVMLALLRAVLELLACGDGDTAVARAIDEFAVSIVGALPASHASACLVLRGNLG